MNINKISLNFKPTFTSYYETGFSIYDDDEERPSTFDYLRKSIEMNSMPYYDYITEKPNITEVISRLTQNVGNFKNFAPDRYCGETLINNTEDLIKLKNTGIERVIDLVGFSDYRKVCEDIGLEYIAVPELNSEVDLWAHPICCNDKFTYLRNAYLSSIADKRLNLTPEERQQKILNDYDTKITRFKKEFIEYINAMKKGNLYVGCGYGINRTLNALKLDNYFDTEAQHYNFTEPQQPVIEAMKNLYYKLDSEDKTALGFTDEFENKLQKRLGIKKDGE